ncbi:MAG: divergent PAP2 family protein [Clostridia bacterium]|nr:divergent PAP2 family protein [Clostridia bacterium]
MTLILDFLKNYILMAALCSWLITQVLKFFVAWIADGHPDPRRLFGDGGMPSGHSATVVCTAVMVGYTCGFASPVFGLAFILAIIVMHDATGVRRETGKQAVVLLDIFSTLGDAIFEGDSIRRREKLKTMVGHTPMQVFFGAIAGVVIAILYIWIFGITYRAYA